jgi:hypothetical protein
VIICALNKLAAMLRRGVPGSNGILDLLRKSGEFFVMKEDLDDQTEAANEGI